MKAFLARPIEGDWPHLWIDATYVRQNGRIVSVAVIIAVGVNSDGRREVLGMDIGPFEAGTFWTAFLRKLARRGLHGVKLVVSDAHEGIKATVAKVLNASWQRCRVHFMRNALAHAGKSGRRVVSAFIATAFAQDDAEPQRYSGARSSTSSAPSCPGLPASSTRPKPTFPPQHRTKLHSTNPIERLNGEIKAHRGGRHLPSEDAIVRLIGAILLEQNDEWVVQRTRYMTLETIAPLSDDPTVSLPAIASQLTGPALAGECGDPPPAPQSEFGRYQRVWSCGGGSSRGSGSALEDWTAIVEASPTEGHAIPRHQPLDPAAAGATFLRPQGGKRQP